MLRRNARGVGLENHLSRPSAGSSLRAVAICGGAAISMVVNRTARVDVQVPCVSLGR